MAAPNRRLIRLFGTNPVAEFAVGNDWTVGDLKRAIEAHTTITINRQILIRISEAANGGVLGVPLLDDSQLLETTHPWARTSTMNTYLCTKPQIETLVHINNIIYDGKVKRFSVVVDVTATVGQLKEKIHTSQGVPPRHQHLSALFVDRLTVPAAGPSRFLEVPLSDNHILKDMLPDDASIFLRRMPRGATIPIRVIAMFIEKEETFPMEVEVDTVNSLLAEIMASPYLGPHDQSSDRRLHVRISGTADERTGGVETLAQCGLNANNSTVYLELK